MIKGSCHCGRVKYVFNDTPASLTRCNCSYCRRAGWLLAYSEMENITLEYDEADVIKYVHGDKTLAFVSCKHCGCTTHWEPLNPEEHSRMAVNVRMAAREDIRNIPIRDFDGADSWTFLDEA